jgi:hypothetical protein
VDFADLGLEKGQEDLLSDLVDADRRVEDNYHQFILAGVDSGYILIHPKLDNREVDAGDVRTLHEHGLLRQLPTSGRQPNYEVTPVGRRYYAWMKGRQGDALEAVEVEVRRFLDAATFQEHHATAYEQWVDAERALWAAEGPAELSALGHACRGSLELFITDLVTKYQPANVNPDPQKTVDRLRSVMSVAGISQTVDAFSIAYFGTVWDLVQRQEHGAQKEGKALTEEDARRCVFQTALVMFELDRSVG